MDKAQGLTKLSTPPCEVKTVVMPVMTIGTNNLEEEIAVMKAILE